MEKAIALSSQQWLLLQQMCDNEIKRIQSRMDRNPATKPYDVPLLADIVAISKAVA